MPIYEYRCPQCGVFEATQRITESPLATCPTCASEVHRLISLTSFVLKGSGWYATDYARSNGKSESGGDSVATDATSNDSAGKDTASSSDSAKTPAAESGKSPSSEKTTTAKSTD
jgi:putative FmdB family regulatory protein